MKYVYYDPATKQVMAEFDTPNLSSQKNWEAKGYIQAIVPEGMKIDRDMKVTVNAEGIITKAVASINPEQAIPQPDKAAIIAARESIKDKLRAQGFTEEEINILAGR